MKPQDEHKGYAHDHLGAIEKGMPVFDSEEKKIGVVDVIEFTPDEATAKQTHLANASPEKKAELLRSGYIQVRDQAHDTAYFATGEQIRFVNEGVVQLDVPLAALTRV